MKSSKDVNEDTKINFNKIYKQMMGRDSESVSQSIKKVALDGSKTQRDAALVKNVNQRSNTSYEDAASRESFNQTIDHFASRGGASSASGSFAFGGAALGKNGHQIMSKNSLLSSALSSDSFPLYSRESSPYLQTMSNTPSRDADSRESFNLRSNTPSRYAASRVGEDFLDASNSQRKEMRSFGGGELQKGHKMIISGKDITSKIKNIINDENPDKGKLKEAIVRLKNELPTIEDQKEAVKELTVIEKTKVRLTLKGTDEIRIFNDISNANSKGRLQR